MRITTSIKNKQEYLRFKLQRRDSGNFCCTSRTKSGYKGNRGRMDCPYFPNCFRMVLEEVRERTRKRKKIASSLNKPRHEKRGRTQHYYRAHLGVLSTMRLTKSPRARSGVKHPLRIDWKLQQSNELR